MKQLIFLDFDETLFDHNAMLVWLDEIMSQKYGARSGAFAEMIDDYHERLDSIHRLYRHREHFETVGRSWAYMSGQVRKLAREQQKDFCYSDTHELLDRLVKHNDLDVRILTFGDSEYQLYKLSMCSELASHGLPVHVVQEPKRDFLAREFPNGGILADDKYPLGLPVSWQHVLVDRTGKFAQTKLQAGVRRVTSLGDV